MNKTSIRNEFVLRTLKAAAERLEPHIGNKDVRQTVQDLKTVIRVLSE